MTPDFSRKRRILMASKCPGLHSYAPGLRGPDRGDHWTWGFIYFHPRLSRRLHLPFFTTREFLLSRLKFFKFRFSFGLNSPRFLAISDLFPLPPSTNLDRESLGPAHDCLDHYPDWLCPVPSGPSPVPFSEYDSSVCWDRIIGNALLVDWVPFPASGLVGRGNSTAPYSVVILKPKFLARSSPLTPPSMFQDSYLV